LIKQKIAGCTFWEFCRQQDISLTQLTLGSYRYFRAMDGFVALNLAKASVFWGVDFFFLEESWCLGFFFQSWVHDKVGVGLYVR